MTSKWTLIAKTVEDHITLNKGEKKDTLIRRISKAKNNWSNVAKIVNGHKIKNGTQNTVIRRLLDIKTGKITSLSQISGSSDSSGGSSSSSSGNSDSSSSNGGSTDSSSGGDGSSSSDGGSGTVKKVPITDPQKAMDFALREWNKIKRTSGHTLETQVFGNNNWKTGEWCKVYIPSLNEYIDMYITKVDHSNSSDSEWLTNITLMDYASSLSEPEEEEEDEDESTSSDGTTDDGSTSGDGGSNGSSIWTEVAKILQENYESNDWDSFIRSVVDAKSWDEIKTKVVGHKQKNSKSYADVIQDLCKVKGIGY